jgi:hypothetical protein
VTEIDHGCGYGFRLGALAEFANKRSIDLEQVDRDCFR